MLKDDCSSELIFIELISNTPQSAPRGGSRRTRGRARRLCADYCKWLASLMSSHQPLEPPAVTSYLMVIIWKASVWKMFFFFFSPSFSQIWKLINWALKVPLWSEAFASLHTFCTAGEFIIVISVNGHIYSFIRNWCWVLYEIPSQTTKIFSTAFILLVLLRGIHLGYILKVLGSIKAENLALYLYGYRSVY